MCPSAFGCELFVAFSRSQDMNLGKQNRMYIERDLDEDEIDLGKLLQMLWKQKVVIVSITTFCLLVAGAYLFLATPVYQVQSVLHPAAMKELDAINRTGLYTMDAQQALQRVGARLESYDVRLSYYRTHQELFDGIKDESSSLEQSFDVFNKKAFEMLGPDPRKEQMLSPYIGIQLTYPAGVDGVAVVNGLVADAIQLERERISNDVNVLIQNRLSQLELKTITARAKYEAEKEARIATLLETNSLKRATLQDELNALREKIKTRRMNRIEELGEAITIAKALGIKKPVTPSAFGENGNVAQGNVQKTEIINQKIPLYFFGNEVLEAEHDALSKRKSDDFTEPRIAEIQKELRLLEHVREVELLNRRKNEALFFENQADLRQEATRLRNLKIDVANVELVTIDQQAVEPMGPIKPRKGLILVLSIFLGLFFGVVVALIRSSVQRMAVPSG